MYRKLRDPYAAVLQCLVTDMDQIGGRKGLSVPAFLLYRKLRDPRAAVLLCLVPDMDQIGGRTVQAVPAF